MHIVIAGGGLMGITLAHRLLHGDDAKEHYVVLLDRDSAVCDYAYHQIGAIAICGSATSLRTLEEAGIKRADVAVALMRNDADNLAFCLLAKRYGVERVLVRLRETDFREAYELAGATTIIPEVDLLINRFVTSIEEPQVRGLIDIGHELELLALDVPVDSPIDGKTVAEIAQDPIFAGCNFVATYDRYGQLEIPRGPTEIHGGGEVILIASKSRTSSIVRYFNEGA